MIIESGDRIFPSVKCLEMETFFSRNQPQEVRDVKSLKSEEKVPAGEKTREGSLRRSLQLTHFLSSDSDRWHGGVSGIKRT